MAVLRLVLGDQLTRNISALHGLDDGDMVLMAEVRSETSYVKHHKKKIAFLFSAMRHFAGQLRDKGINVSYREYDDRNNASSLLGEVKAAVSADDFEAVIVTEPGEYRLLMEMQNWPDDIDMPVHIRPDHRFIADHAEFAKWADGRKQYRMEFFYREMRRKTGILMTGDGEPEGGEWNYDQENRKPPKEGLNPPPSSNFSVDEVTEAVLDLVEREFDDHFGDLRPFNMAVTDKQAEAALTRFIDRGLPWFGDYQDAMVSEQPFMYHSLISAYINAGLLDPLRCCERAVAAYHDGHAPLNAVEGFVRQIIGWREFVRGLYWLKMPEYAALNELDADRPLPEFYWTGETDMACLADAVRNTKQYAYAHHIQRLMVLGNFALLTGVAPDAINEWFLVVYADAYEWVELPNVHGMAIYADGGVLGSKPYASSGKYIDRMSNYCTACPYDVKAGTGDNACPFNYLYWDFLMRNEDSLRNNQRMGMIYSTLRKMDAAKRDAIRTSASEFFDNLQPSSDHWYVRARSTDQTAIS